MQDTYEVVVTQAGKTMFQEAFYNYMGLLGFAHMSIGGRLGGLTSYDFTSDSGTVSLDITNVDQSHFKLTVHSTNISVQPLVLDALTEGVADFLEPFYDKLDVDSAGSKLRNLISQLRDSFEQTINILK